VEVRQVEDETGTLILMGRALTITTLVWALGTGLAWCQQPQQPAGNTQSPNPSGQSTVPAQPLPAINPSTGTVATPEPAPSATDTRPIAGAEEITPELPGSTHSYAIPSFSVWEGADSNAQLVPGMHMLQLATIPVGVLDLNVAGRSNQFSLNVGGGGLIYDTASNESAGFLDGGFTDSYTSRRWSFLISDRASYLPQASAGFAGIGFAGAFNNAPFLGVGSGPAALNPIFAPGQSVLAGQFAALSNVSIAQAQYEVNATNSVSVTGSFGIQHYLNDSSGLQSGNNTLTVFSWDHQFSNTDSISVSYTLVRYRYNGGSTALNDNIWRVGYSRRVSHRLSFVGLVGPQVIYSAQAFVPGSQKSTSVTGQASLTYHLPRLSFNAQYLHYVSPGSGVFQGANTDIVSGGVNTQLTRTWDLSLSAADSRNSRLGTFSTVSAFPNPGAINYEYGTLRVNHVMGRHMRAFAVYELQHQTSGAAFVPGSTSTTLFRHIFGIGIELHPRPLGL
jgi:hypothetical protein